MNVSLRIRTYLRYDCIQPKGRNRSVGIATKLRAGRSWF